MQILEQLAPLQLAKEYLPSDIIDILERLGKVNNIPFNQLYYIAENCADRYYSKVIKIFVFLIKRQFTDRQTLLINTARSLKFLEEYANWQAQIWKVLRKYHNLPDDVEDLHSHIDSFKSIIKTNFKHLKEAMSHNVQNIQTSLGIQQTYSSTLCSHVNNIYNKLSELQKHIQHHCMYSHQTDTVQIDAPEYDPHIDGDNQPNTDKKHATVSVQGTLETIPESSILEDDNSIAPENNTAPQNQQETDWPDALTIQIPGVSSTTSDQPPKVMYNRCQIQPSKVDLKIPELEDNSDQDQFTDLDTFIMHHNTHQALGAAALQTVYQTFDPDLPITFHLPMLTTKTDINTILTLFVIQEDRHCMPTSDYYFTNIQPDPIIIPPHRGNNSSSTSQQAAAKNQIPQQTDTLKPGETRLYPSMLAEKQVPVLDLTNSTITSEADLQTAFHSLNLCSTEKEDPSHSRKQSSTEEDTH